ncbi:AAA family ATPase [Desulfobacterales bacterium HSG2]|nr:AAA family ATPase [Desulfobacterales bacterium HSG2]
MLREIKIKGYKSLIDVDVRLSPLSVLFGANAAGKSNFLDALQLLSGMAAGRTLKDAFEPPYRGRPLESFTFGNEGIRGLLTRKTVSLSMEADVELSDAVAESVNRQICELPSGLKHDETSVREKYLRYRIEIEMFPKSGELRVTDEYLAALDKDGKVSRKRRPFLEKIRDQLYLRTEGHAHQTCYDQHPDHSILSVPLYPHLYPHLTAMRQELAGWSFFYFEPRERMRAPSPIRETRNIGPMGNELASFLNTLRVQNKYQFNAIEKALRMFIPNVTGIDVGPNDLGEVELRLMENETPVPTRVLSEGTLRLIGLLALNGSQEPPALLGLEEPENGVHPRRIRMIADLLETRAATGRTQLIVTTHTPILADMLCDENLFVCRKESEGTVIEPLCSWGNMRPENDTDKAQDTEDISVSELILRGDFGHPS